MSDQITFGNIEFADNPEPRCPCILLLDVSASMSGQPISELNAGLSAFKEELFSDPLALKRVEVAVVTFGPVKIEVPFQSAEVFNPPELASQGDTPLGAAIIQALEILKIRKLEYKKNGISHYRPWVFMITDGAPTDNWQNAKLAIKEGEESKSFAFFAIGVKGANMGILKQISVREPLMLEGLKFQELFSWLSSSLRSVSRSVLGDDISLESPKGWASL